MEGLEGWELAPGPRCHGYAIGEFLCAGCGGLADVIVSEAAPDDCRTRRPGAPAVTWFAPWRAYVTVELICQGPADPDAPDEAWNHAGEAIDMLATGYEPIGLN